ncbi:hypothetical protein QO003_000958 [Arthrobacter silviterrae]|nr:hypothetical protein [Arthrobacter silviterrae]
MPGWWRKADPRACGLPRETPRGQRMTPMLKSMVPISAPRLALG